MALLGITETINSMYSSIMNALPEPAQKFALLFLLVLVIVGYSLFIWKFHRFISNKNLIGIDFTRYKRSAPGSFSLFINGIIYFIEYIIVLPFLIFFWFSLFTIFLLILNEGLPTSTLLLVSATIVASIRFMSYYKRELADNLASILPSTLLAVSLLNPRFFAIDRVAEQINEIPILMSDILVYFFFIIILEVVLRFFDLIFLWLGILSPQESDE